MKRIKQEQHIEIEEKSQQLKFRMQTEIQIDKHHALCQASDQLEELDYTKLYFAYSGIRKSQIEPRVLFKVLVCAYIKGVYSSRKIEELCRENLMFQWLLEDQNVPDHCTIARFRSNPKLQGAFEDLFFQYIALLEKKGFTEHAEVFVDGTKIESKANKYTFVWLKQVLKQLEKVKGKLKELIAPEGNLTLSKVGAKLEKLNSEIISQGIEVKKGRGHHKPEIVRKRDQIEELRHRWIEYEKKKAICGEKRNSYSKTDPDATFMHMKDDHMNNSQLKPGYNVQFAVNSGFVTGIGVFSDRTDFGTLIPLLSYMQRKHGQKYEKVVADSGYESLATTAGSKKMGRPLSLSLTITNPVRSVPLRLRSAEWKTWATTNRMTALSARMADIWTMFQNILLTPKMVQSEKSLFTVVKTARIVLTVLSAAKQKRRTEEKRFPSAGNSRKCASSLTGILPPKRESCFGATVPSRRKELSDSSSTTAASNAS